MQEIDQILSTPKQVEAAIASLEDEIKRLEALGTQQGSVQPRGGKYRLAWRCPKTKKTKYSKSFDRETAQVYRAQHRRYLHCKRLKTTVDRLRERLKLIKAA